ncbi:MAG: helix-turn-helix domain-containing protein [Faecalibacterium sp.]
MEDFDRKLAEECAAAFAGATEIGCVVSDLSGTTLASYGYSCDACGICSAYGNSKLQCTRSQLYGMTEAERFGGKYIYYCPMGLTCFVSPILGEVHSAAKITVGPFLMIEQGDYIDCELDDLAATEKNAVIQELTNIPTITPAKIQKLSTLLFMSVGFMNKVSANNRLLEMQTTDTMQGEISNYITQLKGEATPPPYPIATETTLIKSIANLEKETSLRLLNELMGHILFSSGHHFEIVKSRMLELLTLIGRAAMAAGANEEQTLILCHQARCTIQSQENTENLCLQLSKSTTQLMDSVFQHVASRHANAIHRCIQYIELHYYNKITLEELAQMVYLSPTYLSRIFREETGVAFSAYLNQVRINKAKALLHHDDLRLTDIAIGIGFEDQSYFTKVFKRLVGVTPLKYRAQLQSGEQAYW